MESPSWIDSVIACLGVDDTPLTRSIIRAWRESVPLPPEANNPLGMPASSPGASRWAKTAYAGFPHMGDFYAALTHLALSYGGSGIQRALTGDVRPGQAWHAIRNLAWPAIVTETDWPAAVLDITGDGFQEAYKTCEPEDRKTSGIVGGNRHSSPSASAVTASTMSGLQSAATVLSALRNRGK